MTGPSSINKRCASCELFLDRSNFGLASKRKDGLDPYCKDCKRAKARDYWRRNTENKKARYRANKESVLAYQKEYREQNRELIAQRKAKYHRERLKKDPAYRARHNARNRINGYLRDRVKFSKTLGCSAAEFKAHIESKFQEGMTWENYGKWEIDHIFPISVAYKEGPESFAKACHYTNLQPLWKADNSRKGDSV